MLHVKYTQNGYSGWKSSVRNSKPLPFLGVLSGFMTFLAMQLKEPFTEICAAVITKAFFFFAHAKPDFQCKIYISGSLRLPIKILECNFRKNVNEKMSLFFFKLIVIITLVAQEEAHFLVKLLNLIFPFLFFFFLSYSSQPTSPILLTAALDETWNITWLNQSSLSSFPSLPFLVSILCLSGSSSLLETRVDGDRRLSQFQRTLRSRACPLSQSHSTRKEGFVSLPLTCLKYRCLYLCYVSEAPLRISRKKQACIHLILGRLAPKNRSDESCLQSAVLCWPQREPGWLNV